MDADILKRILANEIQVYIKRIIHYAAAAAKSLQSCPTLSDPMDCSLPGSSVHGIFQVRVLEWVAIAFSIIHYNQMELFLGMQG